MLDGVVGPYNLVIVVDRMLDFNQRCLAAGIMYGCPSESDADRKACVEMGKVVLSDLPHGLAATKSKGKTPPTTKRATVASQNAPVGVAAVPQEELSGLPHGPPRKKRRAEAPCDKKAPVASESTPVGQGAFAQQEAPAKPTTAMFPTPQMYATLRKNG